MNVAIIQNGEETVAKVDGRLDTLSATELGDSLSAYTCTPQINLVGLFRVGIYQQCGAPYLVDVT